MLYCVVRIWKTSVPLLDDPLRDRFIVQYLDHCDVLRVGPRCGLQRYLNNILVLYTNLACVHTKPANTPSTAAAPLPCETHPAQRLSITPVGNPPARSPPLLPIVHNNTQQSLDLSKHATNRDNHDEASYACLRFSALSVFSQKNANDLASSQWHKFGQHIVKTPSLARGKDCES